MIIMGDNTGGNNMTLGELRTTYSSVHKEYNSTKYDLSVKLNEMKDRIANTPNGNELYGEQAATLLLQYNAVKDQQQVYDSFIQQFMQQWNAKLETTAAQQNAEASEDYAKEMGKIMTVAQRMCHGDKVPASDEKKLMEYDSDLYKIAKNAQMMAQLEKRKEYKSLWEDEENKEYEDPIEAADSTETDLVGPDVISVNDVMESATASEPETPE
jgi:hypothetical protein